MPDTTHIVSFSRPFWFRAVNAVWQPSYFLGTKIRVDKDDLIRAARKLTGLQDLGSDFWDEPLERMLRSMNDEAELNPVGRFITRERVKGLLSVRLRAESYFKKFPEILEQELYPAWIIIGLQRTGTTKLLRLLASDPRHRVIPSWEVINPVPYSTPRKGMGTEGDDPKRVSIAKTSARAVKLMSPGFYAIHPIEVFEPEEDILLLDVSFLSTTPEAMMHVPSYADWLEKTDQSPAYAYYVKLLKFLQWLKPAQRWVLKTPHHLEFPDLIGKYFNDVKFLWPHRNIYESVPSFLSMVSFNNAIFSRTVDPQRIARHWVRKTGYMLDKALQYRNRDANESKFVDIYYKDLIADSIAELNKLYSLDGGLPPDQAERFKRHEMEHPHRKYGTHHYSLSDFGLTTGDIDLHTKHYQEFLARHDEREQAKKIQ